MSSKSEKTITDWKKLWQLVSGVHYETPNETVKSKLFDLSKELCDGIVQYKPCSTSSKDMQKFLKENKQEKLSVFAHKLQHLLDLDTEQCWEILCCYLVNEYGGSAVSLASIIVTETNLNNLLNDIWNYYSLERTILLKIVKNILEFYTNCSHPYQSEYKALIGKITLQKMFESYLKQLNYLVNETTPIKLVPGEFLNYQMKLVAWSERNSREIIEILHILILLTNYIEVGVEDIKKLLTAFKSHSFGRQQKNLDAANLYHCELITKISFNEIALFLHCLDFVERKKEVSWIRELRSVLENEIISLHHNPEHGPILLIWMLVNFRDPDVVSDNESVRKYRQFGVKAVHLDVFLYMYTILHHRMFKDESLVAKIIRKTIYNHMCHLCELFDGDGSIGKYPHVYDLLCELLSSPNLAARFCNDEDEGVRSLYETVLENFPIDFINLSAIAHSLTSAGFGDYVNKELENLPIYCEIYDEYKYILRPSQVEENSFILQNDFVPFKLINYTIPTGTSAILVNSPNKTVVHFRTKINYFNVLHNEINVILSRATHLTDTGSCQLKCVTAGIKYLAAAIKYVNSVSGITEEMVHPIELCIDLMKKIRDLMDPPIELLGHCLDVCSALLPHFGSEILARVEKLDILPSLSSEITDFKHLGRGSCFSSNLVGLYLVNLRKVAEKCNFLLSYLNFLHNHYKLERNKPFAVEIPGLLFLVREVFPGIHSWHFQSKEEKNKIYSSIMLYMCDILDVVIDDTDMGKNKKLLRDICVSSLLNLENGLVLLKLISTGNLKLQKAMENESNWITSSPSNVYVVRLAMKILMQVLRLKTTVFPNSEFTPIETLIYSQPKQRDNFKIVPVVTTYMNNIFDRWIPILSCRLLRRISFEFKMSLFACIGMDSDQIRSAFLQKLPDELESDDLKIAILEFVEACVEKQPGLTEAFFSVYPEKDKRIQMKNKTVSVSDSILPFMADYLDAIAADPNVAKEPLPCRIMSLFHTLWKNGLQGLVGELVEKSSFWPSLCNPLFDTFKKGIKIYWQLFNILGIELFRCNANFKLNENLRKLLQKFFEGDCFDKWIEHVFDLPQISIEDHIAVETPEWLSRLQSFKDFMIILLKKDVKEIEIPDAKKKFIAMMNLKVLIKRAECTDDLRPFLILSELYLMLLQNFKHLCIEKESEDGKMITQIIALLTNVASFYEDIHIRAKLACLSITIQAVSLLSTEILNDSADASKLLYPIIDIIYYELKKIDVAEQSKCTNIKTILVENKNSLILSLHLLKAVAVIFQADGPMNWDYSMLSNRVVHRLMNCLIEIIQISSAHNLSNALLDVLIVFARGNNSNAFLYSDMNNFLWLSLLIPNDFFEEPQLSSETKENSWMPSEWWPIYSKGIELVLVLLQKHKYLFVEDAIAFVGAHEDALVDAILLPKQSMEPKAVGLVKNSIRLVSELMLYEKQWRPQHSSSREKLRKSLQMLLVYAISLLYRPKILKLLADGSNFIPELNLKAATNFVVHDLIEPMNDLFEIIILCSYALQRFSPHLFELLCEPEISIRKWEPLIEVEIGGSKLSDTSSPQLSSGCLVSAVCVFIKALNMQNYMFSEIPLNVLPTNDAHENTNETFKEVTDKSLSLDKTQLSKSKERVSKSLSNTAQASSISSPANELLLNINSENCVLALEIVLTLLASQSLLILRDPYLSNRDKQLIRREISNELISFHEFVRKKILVNVKDAKSMWYRKKYGLVMMSSLEPDEEPQFKIKAVDARRNSDHLNSMRVIVTRQQHLLQQEKQRKSSLDITEPFSPIRSAPQRRVNPSKLQLISSTPNQSSRDARISRDTTDNCEREDRGRYDDAPYSPLSYVQLVQEDFLHFLSNLFTVICHSD